MLPSNVGCNTWCISWTVPARGLRAHRRRLRWSGCGTWAAQRGIRSLVSEVLGVAFNEGDLARSGPCHIQRSSQGVSARERHTPYSAKEDPTTVESFVEDLPHNPGLSQVSSVWFESFTVYSEKVVGIRVQAARGGHRRCEGSLGALGFCCTKASAAEAIRTPTTLHGQSRAPEPQLPSTPQASQESSSSPETLNG